MSGPRMGISHLNGNTKRPPLSRVPSGEKSTSSQHDELIKYIFDSWSKVSQEMGRSSGPTVVYYKPENHNNLNGFQPFDLEAYLSRRTRNS